MFSSVANSCENKPTENVEPALCQNFSVNDSWFDNG